jgi:hypothetical protein
LPVSPPVSQASLAFLLAVEDACWRFCTAASSGWIGHCQPSSWRPLGRGCQPGQPGCARVLVLEQVLQLPPCCGHTCVCPSTHVVAAAITMVPACHRCVAGEEGAPACAESWRLGLPLVGPRMGRGWRATGQVLASPSASSPEARCCWWWRCSSFVRHLPPTAWAVALRCKCLPFALYNRASRLGDGDPSLSVRVPGAVGSPDCPQARWL